MPTSDIKDKGKEAIVQNSENEIIDKFKLKENSASLFEQLKKQHYRAGDVCVFDIDETLLYTQAAKKYKAKPIVTHPKLASLIKSLQKQGVICIGLTARKPEFKEKTLEQLSLLDIEFSLASELLSTETIVSGDEYESGVFFAPSVVVDGAKYSTKGINLLTILNQLNTLAAETYEQHQLAKSVVANRVHIFDDKDPNLLSIKEVIETNKEYLGVNFLSLTKINAKPILTCTDAKETLFPDSIASLVYVEHLGGGSGGVHVLEEPITKQRYTFKAHESINHLQEEIIADSLYKAAGCLVPDFAVYSQIPTCLKGKGISRNGIYRLSTYIHPLDKKMSHEQMAVKMRKHFILDALFINWDIAVGDFKNVIINEDGQLVRIDNGGALRYRAVKGEKTKTYESSSLHHVEELTTLRDEKINHHAASVYADISTEEMVKQHQYLLGKINKICLQLDELNGVLNIKEYRELQGVLAARLYDLEVRLNTKPHPFALAYENITPHEKHNSASTLLITLIEGKPHCLLGKRIRHEWYGNLGGKSENSDEDLISTACRETKEESAGMITISPYLLAQSPSHDLISQRGSRNYTHRMYMLEYKRINEVELTKKIMNQSAGHSREFTDFEWVPLEALLNAVNSERLITEEGKITGVVQFASAIDGSTQTISLHPPMHDMLKQPAVQHQLEEWINSKKSPRVKRTRGHVVAEYGKFSQPQSIEWLEEGSEHTTLGVKKRRVVYLDKKTKRKYSFIENVYQDPGKLRHEVSHSIVNAVKITSSQLKKRKLKTKHELDSSSMVYSESSVFSRHTPTQTIAYLQAKLGTECSEPEKLIADFLAIERSKSMSKDELFKEKINEVLTVEINNADKAVLYHATNNKIGFFVEFISSLRNQIMKQSGIISLRAFDYQFSGLESIEDFVTEQMLLQGVEHPRRITNFSDDYKSKAISCNFSLFGNTEHITSSTLDYWYDNDSRSYKTLMALEGLLTKVLLTLGINTVTAEDLLKLFEEDWADLGGVLYQILMNPETLDKISYLSGFCGSFHSFDTPWNEKGIASEQHSLLPLISLLRTDPQGFADNEVLSSQSSLQARLLLLPALMHDKKNAQVNSYKRSSFEKAQEFSRKMDAITRQISLELIRKESLLNSYYTAANGVVPMQRLNHYVKKGVFGDEVIREQFTTYELIGFIKADNISLFNFALERAPVDLDASVLLTTACEFRNKKAIELLLNRFDDLNVTLDVVNVYGLALQYASDEDKDCVLFVEHAIKQNYQAFEFASERLNDNEKLVMMAIKNSGVYSHKVLLNASDRLKNNKEVVINAIKRNPSACRYMGVDLQNDKSFIIKLINMGCSFNDINEAMKAEPDVVLTAIKKEKTLFKYASDELKQDKDFVYMAIETGAPFSQVPDTHINDKEIVLAAVKKNGLALEYMDDPYNNDVQIVRLAVNENGMALEFASSLMQDNKEIVIDAVKKSPKSYRYASDSLKADPELAMLAVKANEKLFKYIDKSLRDDLAFMMKLVKINPVFLLEASPRLQSKKKLVSTALKKDGTLLENINESLRNEYDIVLAAVKNAPQAIEYASEELKANESIALQVLKKDGQLIRFLNDGLKTNESLVIKAVGNSAKVFDYIDEGFKANRKVMLAAVKKQGKCLAFASETLRSDKKLVLQAIKTNPGALSYANDDMKNDYDVVLQAVSQDGTTLVEASEDLRNNPAIVLTAVKQYGNVLQYANEDLKNNREIVMQAVKQNGYALRFASEALKGNRKIVLQAIKQKSEPFVNASEHLKCDRGFILKAVKQNGSVLKYVSEQFQKDKDVVLQAVKQNGLALKYASDDMKYDQEIVLEAVKQDGRALQFAREGLNDDHNIVIHAVRQNGVAIQFAGEFSKNSYPVARAAVIDTVDALYHLGKRQRKSSDIIYHLLKTKKIDIRTVDKELWSNRAFVLMVVKLKGHYLQYASKKLRNDEEIVTAAISENDWASYYIGDELSNNRRFMIDLIDNGLNVDKGLGPELCDDYDFMSYAMNKLDTSLIHKASYRLRCHKEFVLQNVRDYGYNLKWACISLRNDLEVVHEAMNARYESEQAVRYAGQDYLTDHENLSKALEKTSWLLEQLTPEIRATKSLVLIAVSHGGYSLVYASEELKNDKEVVLAAIASQPRAIQFASDDLKNDYEIANYILEHEIQSIQYLGDEVLNNLDFARQAIAIKPDSIQYMSEDLRDNPELMTLTVKQDGFCIRHASETIKNNYTIALLAVSNCYIAFEYLSDELRSNPEIALAAIRQNAKSIKHIGEGLNDNKEFMLEVMKCTRDLLIVASDRLKDDKDVVLEAVKKSGCGPLKYASDRLRDDEEIVLAALNKNSYYFEYAGQGIRDNKKVMLKAVSKDGAFLEYASKTLKCDDDIVWTAIQKDPSSIKYASESHRNNPKYALHAVQNSKYALRYVGESMKSDPKIVYAAVKNGTSLEEVPEHFRNDRKLVLSVVRKRGYQLKFASDALKNDPVIVIEAMKNSHCVLSNAGNALRNDPKLKSIENKYIAWHVNYKKRLQELDNWLINYQSERKKEKHPMQATFFEPRKEPRKLQTHHAEKENNRHCILA